MALFRRYKINIKQLNSFLTEENKKVLRNCKESYSINVYPAEKYE